MYEIFQRMHAHALNQIKKAHEDRHIKYIYYPVNNKNDH